jgi:hypothetical protein
MKYTGRYLRQSKGEKWRRGRNFTFAYMNFLKMAVVYFK